MEYNIHTLSSLMERMHFRVDNALFHLKSKRRNHGIAGIMRSFLSARDVQKQVLSDEVYTNRFLHAMVHSQVKIKNMPPPEVVDEGDGQVTLAGTFDTKKLREYLLIVPVYKGGDK